MLDEGALITPPAGQACQARGHWRVYYTKANWHYTKAQWPARLARPM
jgi:hypothetical protein